MRLLFIYFLATCVLFVGGAHALDFTNGNAAFLLDEKRGWFGTGSPNLLEKDPTLFQFTGKRRNRQIHTTSEAVNIHSHFVRSGARRLRNYVYKGQMRVNEEDAGIGVTFYSNYPKSDTYYRLRRYNGGSFTIVPHATEITQGETDTGVTPEVDAWYNFKISVNTSRKHTKIRAKVWRAGEKQPRLWQVVCIDSSETRIKRGAPGLWSMADGTKSWRRLAVKKR